MAEQVGKAPASPDKALPSLTRVLAFRGKSSIENADSENKLNQVTAGGSGNQPPSMHTSAQSFGKNQTSVQLHNKNSAMKNTSANDFASTNSGTGSSPEMSLSSDKNAGKAPEIGARKQLKFKVADFFTDPYQIRADEIGPSHGIPGIGHLGALLTPSGYTPGDVPMDPNGAQAAFQESRQEASKELEDDIAGDENLPSAELEEKLTARNKKWATDLKLHKLILAQRVDIYEWFVGGMAEFDSGRKLLHTLDIDSLDLLLTLN